MIPVRDKWTGKKAGGEDLKIHCQAVLGCMPEKHGGDARKGNGEAKLREIGRCVGLIRGRVDQLERIGKYFVLWMRRGKVSDERTLADRVRPRDDDPHSRILARGSASTHARA